MNHRSKNQLMCRLEGCPHEVLLKTVDNGGGGYSADPLERRASIIRDRNGNPLQGRGSPAGVDGRVPGGYPGHQHRYSSAGASTVASPYCQYRMLSPSHFLFSLSACFFLMRWCICVCVLNNALTMMMNCYRYLLPLLQQRRYLHCSETSA